MEDLEDLSIIDPYGIMNGRRKNIKENLPELKDFNYYPSGIYEKVLEIKWDVKNLIGSKGSLKIYEDDKWIMEWGEIKKSGSHKDFGIISICDKSPEILERIIAHFNVEKAKISKVNVIAVKICRANSLQKRFKNNYDIDIPFVKKIDEHKNMPLYKNLKELLSYK